MGRIVVGLVFALLFFVVRVGLNTIYVDPDADYELSEEAFEVHATELDQWVQEDIASGTAAPARGWLAQGDNMLFEGDPQEAERLIAKLHAAGAQQVWFTGIERFGGKNLSASIAAELPQDPAGRAAILRADADFWGEDEPSPDVGQRYVEFAFD